jgi:hypothetical protein
VLRLPLPDTLTHETLAARWPRLFHLTEVGAWPAIQRDGLLSTSLLLDLYKICGAEREALEAAKRPQTVAIHHPDHGTAWIHDNRPTNLIALRRTLTGMSEDDWFRELNRRVFFWLSETRLDRLLTAQYNRGRPHDVLVLDTRHLLEVHGNRVELSHLNTGAVHRAANYPRGAGTFRTIRDYPWRERSKAAPREPIVELTVPGALTDVASFVVDVRTVPASPHPSRDVD